MHRFIYWGLAVFILIGFLVWIRLTDEVIRDPWRILGITLPGILVMLGGSFGRK